MDLNIHKVVIDDGSKLVCINWWINYLWNIHIIQLNNEKKKKNTTDRHNNIDGFEDII